MILANELQLRKKSYIGKRTITDATNTEVQTWRHKQTAITCFRRLLQMMANTNGIKILDI